MPEVVINSDVPGATGPNDEELKDKVNDGQGQQEPDESQQKPDEGEQEGKSDDKQDKSEDDQQKSGDEEKKTDAEKQAEDALKVAGLSMDDFTKEFQEKGELSDESFEKLEMAGFPRDVVETYIRGVQQTQESQQNEQQIVQNIHKYAGGEQEYRKMVGWAMSNLSEKEQNTFNNIVNSKDEAAIKWAVDGLRSRYTNSVGQDPNYIGGEGPASTEEVFNSTYEVVEAMKDKRYGKDEAYTREVAKKLSRSSVF